MICIDLNVAMLPDGLPVKLVNVNNMLLDMPRARSLPNCRDCPPTKPIIRANYWLASILDWAVGWHIRIGQDQPRLPIQPAIDILFDCLFIAHQFCVRFWYLSDFWSFPCHISFKSLFCMMIDNWRGEPGIAGLMLARINQVREWTCWWRSQPFVV